MFHPNLHQLMKRYGQRQLKRSIFRLREECEDQVELWDRPSVIILSVLAPGVSSAKALTQWKKLACWSVKQANMTSEILTQLTVDVDSVRHATLQNRAGIDFLLLAQGHGCEEFERMCCMNLSCHSESIHRTLMQLKYHVNKIVVVESNWKNG